MMLMCAVIASCIICQLHDVDPCHNMYNSRCASLITLSILACVHSFCKQMANISIY